MPGGTLARRGWDAIFCAPTAAAADTLRKDVYLGKTMTLQKFLADANLRFRLSRGSVMVPDEAGAVGLDDMAKLFELARLKGCRVILSGDTGQHASVTRGDALRILEQYSGYRFEELTTIRRQKPAAFREIVELAAAKQTDKAFAKLLELGAVTETLTDEGRLYQRAADAYLSATKQGRSALLVSPTWSEKCSHPSSMKLSPKKLRKPSRSSRPKRLCPPSRKPPVKGCAGRSHSSLNNAAPAVCAFNAYATLQR